VAGSLPVTPPVVPGQPLKARQASTPTKARASTPAVVRHTSPRRNLLAEGRTPLRILPEPAAWNRNQVRSGLVRCRRRPTLPLLYAARRPGSPPWIASPSIRTNAAVALASAACASGSRTSLLFSQPVLARPKYSPIFPIWRAKISANSFIDPNPVEIEDFLRAPRRLTSARLTEMQCGRNSGCRSCPTEHAT